MRLFRVYCNPSLPIPICILVLLMNTNIQFCKATYYWPSQTAQGQQWPSQTAQEQQWPSQTAQGQQWPSQTAQGQQWPSQTAQGQQWPSQTAQGQQWPSQSAQGQQQICPRQQQSSIQTSTPEQCARSCRDGEPRKYCYYRFHLEYYTSNNHACDFCDTPTNYSRLNHICDCVIMDGFEKTVFSINRMIPGPSIQVCRGDKIIVDLYNDAEGIEATLHWHGIFQDGSQYYDGVPYVTQCPVLSSNFFRYQFSADNSGTHFYHSHVSVHMIDGQYGSLIVRDPPSLDPHYNRYDRDIPEHVIVISDEFHELSMERYPGRYRQNRGQIADNILINGRGNWTNPSTGSSTNVALSTFMVQRGGRYRFRLINAFSTVCLAQITIESHSMQIIATDGENVQPVSADSIITSTGERVDFILYANQTVRYYWIHVRGLGECAERGTYQLANLIYQGSSQSSQSAIPGYFFGSSSRTFAPENSTNCNADLCVDQLRKIYQPNDDQVPLNEPADQAIIMFFDFYNYSMTPQVDALFKHRDDEYKRFYVSPTGSHLDSLMNNISYGNPQGPLISQNDGYDYLCEDTISFSRCAEPCTCAHVYNIPLGAIVDVMVYDRKPLSQLNHPFHLHGYSFCVLYAGQFNNAANKDLISSQDVNQAWQAHSNRVRRGSYRNCAPKDTVVVPNTGYVILRFEANNPGWWFFHCHFTWHTVTGMNVIFHVGKQTDLPCIPYEFPQCYNWAAPVTRK